MRSAEHHRNAQVEELWAGVDAHVVYLYVAGTLEDARRSNWIARAQWTDPELEAAWRPTELAGDEEQDGVSIAWNSQYDAMRRFYQENTGQKGLLVAAIQGLVAESVPLAEQAATAFSRLEACTGSADDFEAVLLDMRDAIENVVTRSQDLPFPPEDLRDLDAAVQSMFSTLSNLSIYYSEAGLETWDQTTRINLVRFVFQDLERDRARVEDELGRVR